MSNLEPVLGLLYEQLQEVAREQRRGAGPTPGDLAGLIRSRCDLTVVLGAVVREGEGAPPYHNPAVGSVSQVVDAVVIDQMSPGTVSWFSEPLDRSPARVVCFIFSMAMGNGSPLPQPTTTFALDLQGEEVARFCLTKSPRQWQREDAVFSYVPIRVDSTPYGRSFDVDEVLTGESTVVDGYGVLFIGHRMTAPGRPNRLSVRALSEARSRNWCRVGFAPLSYPAFYAENHFDALLRAVTPASRPRFGAYELALGDLHTHSGESAFIDGLPRGSGADEACGIGDRRSLFNYARDISGLDFFCLSEHDWQMNAQDWTSLQRLNDAYLSDRFVTVHGYEWTSQLYGHRNVYFRDTPGSLFWSQDPMNPYEFLPDSPSPAALWQHLRDEGLAAITVPHHMSAAQFPLDLRDFFDPNFDRVVEIYSAWGDSLEHGQPVNMGASRVERLEFIRTVRDGYATGFIASSDSHDAHPGYAQGTTARPHLFHHLGSGRAGAFVSDFSRAGIFESLSERRTFAATGEGLTVWTTLDDAPMGSRTRRRPGGSQFDLAVRSDVGLSSLTVYRNGRVTERIDVSGELSVAESWAEADQAGEQTRSLFIKATRSDGESVWSSPHWIAD